MQSVLLLYSTTDGQTLKICSYLQQQLESFPLSVTLLPITEANEHDLVSHDKIVIGASIRYGKHHPQVYQFIAQYLSHLAHKPSAFFSVNVVARKAEKNQPATNPYIQKFLQLSPWQPDLLDVFAGRINYALYKWSDRLMIRFIMYMTKGPTDPDTNIEFTDWQRVDTFAHSVAQL